MYPGARCAPDDRSRFKEQHADHRPICAYQLLQCTEPPASHCAFEASVLWTHNAESTAKCGPPASSAPSSNLSPALFLTSTSSRSLHSTPFSLNITSNRVNRSPTMPSHNPGVKELASRIGLRGICTAKKGDMSAHPTLQLFWEKVSKLCKSQYMRSCEDIREAEDIQRAALEMFNAYAPELWKRPTHGETRGWLYSPGEVRHTPFKEPSSSNTSADLH